MLRSIIVLILISLPVIGLSQDRMSHVAPAATPPPMGSWSSMDTTIEGAEVFNVDSAYDHIETWGEYNKQLPFELEHNLSANKSNAKLYCEIARAFTAQSRYYRTWSNGNSCDDTAHYDYLDSASAWFAKAKGAGIWQVDHDFGGFLAKYYAAKIVERMASNDGPATIKLLIEARIDSAIRENDLVIAREILSECDKEAILLVNSNRQEISSDMLLPLLYLQAVQHERTDLSVVVKKFLGDDPYYVSLRQGVPEVTRPLGFLPADARAYARSAAGISNSQAVATGLSTTLAPTIISKLQNKFGVRAPSTFRDSDLNIRAVLPSRSERTQWIMLTSSWARPIYECFRPDYDYDHNLPGSSSGVREGLVSEILPVDSGLMHGSYLILNKFLARTPFLKTLYADSATRSVLLQCFKSYLEAWRAEAKPDTTELADRFATLWNVYGANGNNWPADLMNITINLYPKYTPTRVKEYLEKVFLEAQPRVDSSAVHPYNHQREISGNVEKYLALAVVLDRCVDVAKTLANFKSIADSHDPAQKTLKEEAKMTVLGIQMYSSSLPCLKRVITGMCFLTLNQSTQFDSLRTELSRSDMGQQAAMMGTGATFGALDSIHAFCILINAHAGEFIQARWFNARTGQIVRTDTSRTADLDLPKRERGDMPANESLAGANFHFSNSKGLPHGTYHVDILMQGEVVTSQTMTVPDLEK